MRWLQVGGRTGRSTRLLIFAVGICLVGQQLFAADPRRPGTVEMANLLARLSREANRAENPFLSDGKVAALRQKIAAEGKADAKTRFALGQALLNNGENAEALREFELVEKLSSAEGPTSAENKANLALNRALCFMRMGEIINCQSNHTSDSCIFPIRGGGVHLWKDGSRNAVTILTNLLGEYPRDLRAVWLLNIAAMTLGEYPDKVPARWRIDPKTFESEYDIKRFEDVAMPAGLAANTLSGGSVVDDFDNDGFLDVMVTAIGLDDQMLFFRNNGNGTFSNRTAEAGLIGLTGGLNIVSADYNNDGFLDALILRGAWMHENGRFPNSLLKNNGDGTFEDVTETARMLSFHPTQTAAWFDFDSDGWLDVFIGNESTRGEPPHPCELYRNNRNGTFTEMAPAAGLRVRDYVKGVVAGDFNNDGRPDLYLSVKGRSNMLLRNDGPNPGGSTNAWRFTDVASEAGVQYPIVSFPAFFFDYDNDGWEDLFAGGYKITDVADVAADHIGQPSKGTKAKLYRNRRNGTFEDVTAAMGLDRVLHAMGCNFGDLDNDGWLDFYLGTGDPDLLTLIPNRMFRNAQGKRFQDVTTSGGFGHLQKGHGISFADIDNDGDQDVFEEMGGAVTSDTYPNVLYRNPGHGNNWVALQLVGVKANRSAVGARVKITVLENGVERVLHRTVSTGGSFGCNPLRLEIGLGAATVIKSIDIRWPGSAHNQTVQGLEIKTFYRVTEGDAHAQTLPLNSFTFSKSSDGSHHHSH